MHSLAEPAARVPFLPSAKAMCNVQMVFLPLGISGIRWQVKRNGARHNLGDLVSPCSYNINNHINLCSPVDGMYMLGVPGMVKWTLSGKLPSVAVR